MTKEQEKYLKIAGIAGIAAGAGVVLYLVFGNKFDNSAAGAASDPTGNGGVLNPTGSFNAKNIANDLYENMLSSGFASFLNPNERDNIFNLLKSVSAPQFAQVVTAFGAKQYNTTLGNQLNPIGFVSELPFYGLKIWLKKELVDSDYNLLRKKYPNNL